MIGAASAILARFVKYFLQAPRQSLFNVRSGLSRYQQIWQLHSTRKGFARHDFRGTVDELSISPDGGFFHRVWLCPTGILVQIRVTNTTGCEKESILCMN